jgi:secretion/DNA translocation related TadE-like protein
MTPRARPFLRSQRGAGTLVVIGVVVVLALVALVGVGMGGFSTAQRATSGAADLVALSAASAYRDGADACAAAKSVASANEVDLTACTVAGDSIDYAVQVVVRRQGSVFGLPVNVTATSVAGHLAAS